MRIRPFAAITALVVPAALALGAVPAVADPAGNNGTIKLSEVGGPEDPSNDPKLSCTFELQWYGFDAGATLYSDVSFTGQGADAGTGIAVTGSTHVFIGEDAAGGGTDHDATQVYVLAFDAPPANAIQGYHVKVTTQNGGSHGADTKTKVFHVQPCASQPVEPTTPTEPAEPTEPVTTDPGHAPGPVVPWSWDWQYVAPACDALTVDYPANIPEGQANDVNIRFSTPAGPLTLNFHHDTGTWSGRTVFTYAGHPQWPAGLTAYDVVWVQVGGTNYHWQGTVACGRPTAAGPAPAEPAPASAAPASPAPASSAPAAAAPAAAVRVTGFRAATASVKRGTAPAAVQVAVSDSDADVLRLQQLTKRGWKKSRTAGIADDGSARVTFPRLTKRGTYRFRVVVDGVASRTLTIKVR